jgi:hypothetical protein
LLRNHPEALDPEKVDGHFLEEICAMNRSEAFFKGVREHCTDVLHSYLARYVILYFDSAFSLSNRWNEYLGEYARRTWSRRSSLPQSYMPAMEAMEVLGITQDELSAMSRRDLTRTYRLRAKELHPDRGGSHEDFVKLTSAYELLLSRK